MSRDEKIKEGLRNSSPEALELLWDAYADGLLAYAQSILRSRHDAEDALHGLFLKVARDAGRLAGSLNLKAYLFRMMRNIALDMMSRRGREEPLEGDAEWLASDSVPEGERISPEEMSKALGLLPEEQRTALELRVWQGMQFNEISELLEIPLNTAASRVRYGLKRLREILGG